MNDREEFLVSLKGLFEKDRVRFTDLVERELSGVRKKSDLDGVLELLSVLKREIPEIAPLIAPSIHPVLVMLIKNHYYREIAEHAGIFEACANISIFRQLEELVSRGKGIRFLTPVENYRIKKLALNLAEKFRADDVVYRLELELQKEDLEWRDDVE